MIVETGQGVAGANSYVSLADAVTFFDDRELTVSVTTGLLIRSADMLNGLCFKGEKTDRDNQMPWPRSGVVDREGYYVGHDEIPQQLINAQLWIAYYVNAGNDPSSYATPEIKREKVDVIETEYAVKEGDRDTVHILSLPNVRDALRGLTTLTGRIERG